MSAQITLDWKKDSTFETQMDGHTVTIDTSKEDGGTGSGVRPKALMLSLIHILLRYILFIISRCQYWVFQGWVVQTYRNGIWWLGSLPCT